MTIAGAIRPRGALGGSETGGAVARVREAWLVALGCLLLTFAFYHPALSFYFVADDVAFVRPDPQWLRNALLPLGTWHYYPVTQLLLSGLTSLTGWHPPVMHALNLLIHAGIGFGLYLLLRQLGLDARVRTLAPLLFVTRGIDYEVVIWITELSYLLVVAFTVFTLATWDRYLRGDGGKFLWLTVAGFAAAVFTIEHALLLLPLYLLYDLMMRRERSLVLRFPRSGEAIGSWVRAVFLVKWQALKRYLPFVLAVVAFFAIKLSHNHALLMSNLPSGPPAPVPSGIDVVSKLAADRQWHGILNAPFRAFLDLLVGASYLFLPVGLTTGAEDTWLTRHALLVLVPWLIAHVWVLWKGRPFTRFLLVWVYVYLLPLSLASVPQARYYYMPTVPAAVLMAMALVAGWKWLARHAPPRVGDLVAIAIVAAVILGEGVFLQARLREWKQSADLVQTAVQALQRDLDAGTRQVVMINLPRTAPGPSFPAFTFSNAAEYLQLMVRPPRFDVTVQPVYDRSFVAERWPTIGTYASRDQIREKLAQPGTIGYEFIGRAPWIERVR